MTDEKIERIMSSLSVGDMLILYDLLKALEASRPQRARPQEAGPSSSSSFLSASG